MLQTGPGEAKEAAEIKRLGPRATQFKFGSTDIHERQKRSRGGGGSGTSPASPQPVLRERKTRGARTRVRIRKDWSKPQGEERDRQEWLTGEEARDKKNGCGCC